MMTYLEDKKPCNWYKQNSSHQSTKNHAGPEYRAEDKGGTFSAHLEFTVY